ncbi:MAG: 1-acyl-sn-glycerol-3-phosphate acyltransferase [Firmicutes bacterium]|nr:1-acyl-sn-glycerol-3-phosphate acyltransferase [Bacillota bacterium]
MQQTNEIKKLLKNDEKKLVIFKKKNKKQLKTKKDIFDKHPLRLFFGKLFVFISYLLFYPLIKIKYRLKIENKNIKKMVKGKGAIIVMNHSSELDGAVLVFQMLPRRTWVTVPEFVASRRLSTIPFPQDLANMRAFKEVISERLEKKQLISFFPEITPSDNIQTIRPFKNGAFRFAVQNNVPILPCAICFKPRKQKKNIAKKYRATLCFFEPIHPNLNINETEAIEEMKVKTHSLISERVEKNVTMK